MTTTAIGLFAGFSEAQRVIHTLVAQGLRSEDIHLVANREETCLNGAVAAGMWGVNVDVGPASRGEPAALSALGVPAAEAQRYAESIRRGGALVSVVAADDQADQALALMERYSIEDLEAQAVPRSTSTL
jgi:hypothetical protein